LKDGTPLEVSLIIPALYIVLAF